jgi:nitrogen fixation NifU-like protein
MTTKLPYADFLLDHYHHPRNKGLLSHADFIFHLLNPSCGDQVTMAGTINDSIITTCQFEGKGCVISLAAASILTTLVIGKTIENVKKLQPQDILDNMQITLGPTRLRCALLSLETLHSALNTYITRKSSHA